MTLIDRLRLCIKSYREDRTEMDSSPSHLVRGSNDGNVLCHHLGDVTPLPFHNSESVLTPL